LGLAGVQVDFEDLAQLCRAVDSLLRVAGDLLQLGEDLVYGGANSPADVVDLVITPL